MNARMQIKAQFYRAHISERDFIEAGEYLRIYRESYSEIIKRSLLFSGIVSYSRPFLNSKSGPAQESTSKLSVKPQKILTTLEFDLHRRVLDLRNRAIAHSEFESKAVSLVSSQAKGFVVGVKLFHLSLPAADVRIFRSMCGKMKMHCTQLMFSLNRKHASMGEP